MPTNTSFLYTIKHNIGSFQCVQAEALTCCTVDSNWWSKHKLHRVMTHLSCWVVVQKRSFSVTAFLWITFEYESSYVEFVQVFEQWRKTELSRTIIEPFVSSVEYEIKQTNLQIFVVVCLTVFSWEFVKMGSYQLIKWVLLLWK